MPTGDAGTFGTLLRRYRLRAGMTQEQLTERARLSARALMYLERGAHRPFPATLRRLAEALALSADEAAALAKAARPRIGVPAPTVANGMPLVGRERDIAMLRSALDAAEDGRGGLVLIGGEAGIGKTALAEALCQEAEGREALVLSGHCYDLTEASPYGAFVDLFTRIPDTIGSPPLPPAFAERGTVGPVRGQLALFVEVRDYLAALAQAQTIAVLLEDLHWADSCSLDLLHFLSRSVASHALLLIATYRSDEVTRSHPFFRALPGLARGATARLELARLTDDAVRVLIDARYGLPDADAARLVGHLRARADGNPLFIGELLRSLEEGGALHREGEGAALADIFDPGIPPVLRHVIDARVSRLGDDVRHLLAIAAVVGEEFPVASLMAIADRDEDAVFTILERAVGADLLRETEGGEGIRFSHALVRAALYEGMPSVRRRRVHRRVAEVLAIARDADPDVVASHFQRAGDERALSWLMKAGERFAAALALMECAPATERGWLLMRLSRLLRWTDVARAGACASAAAGLAEEADDRILEGYARYQRGFLACAAGDVASGLPDMEAGADILSSLSEAEQARFAEKYAATAEQETLVSEGRGMVMTMWRAYVGRYREARAAGERLMVRAERSHDPAVSRTVTGGLFSLGDVYAALGLPEQASAAYSGARAAFLYTGNHAHAAWTAWRELDQVALAYRTADIAGRRRLADLAEAESVRATDAVPEDVPARVARLPLLILEGQWEEAHRLAATTADDERGIVLYRANVLGYLASIARSRGEADRARWAIARGLPAGVATEPGTVLLLDVATMLQRVAAALALDSGDLAAARAWLEAHDRWLRWSGGVRGLSEGHALWAEYFLSAGDGDTARMHAEKAIAGARAPQQPLAMLAAYRIVGMLETRVGRYNFAERHLSDALSLAGLCAAPYERALSAIALAELRAVQGDTPAARTLLGEARTICGPLGAKQALARSDALIARLDTRQPTVPAYPADLSRREVEVLHLVAQGLTNAQVAEQLFISPRTIEQHLRSIYNKLGVSTRTAATRYAVERGLV